MLDAVTTTDGIRHYAVQTNRLKEKGIGALETRECNEPVWEGSGWSVKEQEVVDVLEEFARRQRESIQLEGKLTMELGALLDVLILYLTPLAERPDGTPLGVMGCTAKDLIGLLQKQRTAFQERTGFWSL